jgi:hypothetical protein
VLGGGLDKDRHWKASDKKFFLPVKVMSAVFRRNYLDELKSLHEDGKLVYSKSATRFQNSYEFKELLDHLYQTEWVVYTKETFAGAQEVFKYLGKYTHRIAISNRRIISFDDRNVIFCAKDYKDGGKYKSKIMSGESFLTRFLLHVLPKGFVRIWYYGILACRSKHQNMTLCRNLLGCQKYLSRLRNKTTAEKILILYKKDINKCAKCGRNLISYRIPGKYMLC